jgi:hypothetical protein
VEVATLLCKLNEQMKVLVLTCLKEIRLLLHDKFGVGLLGLLSDLFNDITSIGQYSIRPLRVLSTSLGQNSNQGPREGGEPLRPSGGRLDSIP